MHNTHTQKNYALGGKSDEDLQKDGSVLTVFAKMKPMLGGEGSAIVIAVIATLVTSLGNLVAPLLIGRTIDTYLIQGDYTGVLRMSMYVGLVYVGAFIASYTQMRVMGGVAQRVLWRLRNSLFAKLQELPLSFFNQNKSGDLISRINSDTEKVNQFFSQSLVQFVGYVFMIIGTGVFVISINWKLGLMALTPAVVILVFTIATSSWVKKVNKNSFKEGGLLSACIQESVTNMKVILAFNRRDYFRNQFEQTNKKNFTAAMKAGVANEIFTPVYEYLGNIAMLLTLGYGLVLIASGEFAVGLLVSFVIYVTRFYDPLRQMARLWATLQSALASWDRINVILQFTSDLMDTTSDTKEGNGLLEFRNVSFKYVDGKEVLKHINFTLEKGKTYALVGPTGGGKTTTASLIARLFDPTEGVIYLEGKNMRAYSAQDRVKKIGFILQDPYLFTGTIRENLAYGFVDAPEHIEKIITEVGLESLLSRFDKGLDTEIGGTSSLSLGEKQIIAFMRAVIRKPDILILDEATANIDTVTEQILEGILTKLPSTTTKIIIAHRLNTIENSDSIFFVNGTQVQEAGSMEHAVDMLLHGKKES